MPEDKPVHVPRDKYPELTYPATIMPPVHGDYVEHEGVHPFVTYLMREFSRSVPIPQSSLLGHSPRQGTIAHDAIAHLSSARVRVGGGVLNDVDVRRRSYYSGYSYYRTYYSGHGYGVSTTQ